MKTNNGHEITIETITIPAYDRFAESTSFRVRAGTANSGICATAEEALARCSKIHDMRPCTEAPRGVLNRAEFERAYAWVTTKMPVARGADYITPCFKIAEAHGQNHSAWIWASKYVAQWCENSYAFCAYIRGEQGIEQI